MVVNRIFTYTSNTSMWFNYHRFRFECLWWKGYSYQTNKIRYIGVFLFPFTS